VPFVSDKGWRFVPPDERAFNVKMSRLRITNEWIFGIIVSAWARLRCVDSLRVRGAPVAKYYICATDLTNIRTIIRGGNNVSFYFGMTPPPLEEYVAPRVFFVPGVEGAQVPPLQIPPLPEDFMAHGAADLEPEVEIPVGNLFAFANAPDEVGIAVDGAVDHGWIALQHAEI
jgi:hypothetical protein